jgi:hypothetical protein
MKILIQIFIILFVFNASFAQTQIDTNQLIGQWVLEANHENMTSSYVLKIESNGNFIQLDFDSTTNSFNQTKAIGVWTIQDSIFSLTRMAETDGRQEVNPTTLIFLIKKTKDLIYFDFISDTKKLISTDDIVTLKRK